MSDDTLLVDDVEQAQASIELNGVSVGFDDDYKRWTVIARIDGKRCEAFVDSMREGIRLALAKDFKAIARLHYEQQAYPDQVAA